MEIEEFCGYYQEKRRDEGGVVFNWYADQQPGLGLEFAAELAFINLFVSQTQVKVVDSQP